MAHFSFLRKFFANSMELVCDQSCLLFSCFVVLHIEIFPHYLMMYLEYFVAHHSIPKNLQTHYLKILYLILYPNVDCNLHPKILHCYLNQYQNLFHIELIFVNAIDFHGIEHLSHHCLMFQYLYDSWLVFLHFLQIILPPKH